MDSETKQALEAMESRILERFDQTDKKLGTRFEEVYKRIEKVETNLLSAFRDWSTTMELRLQGIPLIEKRLTVMEDRVAAVERKLLERGI